MKIERTLTSNWSNAIWGMRCPMNSWSKSDSKFTLEGGLVLIGEADNALAKKLIKAGTEHRKFLRLIHVSCFITIPRYIWQELDTYKVATVRMSCSTMHKLGSQDLDLTDFQDNTCLPEVLTELNSLGVQYRVDKDVQKLRRMKQILPEGFLQGAIYDANYETLMNIYHQRKQHRMSEWTDEICVWIESLPMMNEWLKL